MKKIFFYFSILIFASNCATNELTIKITEPAAITLPADIDKVGVLNRTNSPKNTTNKIDELITLELLTIDSTAALKAINGLCDELKRNHKFTVVKDLKPMYIENSVIQTFSPILPKNKVAKICENNDLEALFVLEYFDTNTKFEYDIVPVKANILGVEVNAVETQATVNSSIRLGWRIYNAPGDILFDELALNKHAVSSGRGINPLNAIAAVTGQKALVETISYNTGIDYAKDLLPFSHRVRRIYYVKGSENFKIGKRLARAGQWDKAADYWQKETKNPKRKITGRAYYNMAIINEINGNINQAIKWAEDSYTLFNNKKALHYLNTLKFRKAKIDELNRQQGGL